MKQIKHHNLEDTKTYQARKKRMEVERLLIAGSEADESLASSKHAVIAAVGERKDLQNGIRFKQLHRKHPGLS